MPEPIIVADQALKDDYIQLVCLHTKLQYSKAPTTYPELIETALDRDLINLERDLIKHPLTNVHMHFAILTRVAWAVAVLYELADPATKRKMLFRMRDTLRAVQRWPEAWQEAMGPTFAHWLNVLNEEERNGAEH
jgi:hypothetical protein